MALRRMQVTDFRCLQSAELEFDPDFTLITGPNASGKTSVLEAVYVLGRGRSFRTRRLDNVIRAGASRFVVFGEIELGPRTVPVGVEGSSDGVRAKMAGSAMPSLAQLAAVLPAQIIDPEVHRLIEEGPSQRRRFLDWGVFHVEHGFLKQWQSYQQVLRQRNAALRLRQPRPVVSAWDAELVRLGVIVDAARSSYLERLSGLATRITTSLLGLDLTLTYRSGWNRELTLEAALAGSWSRDQELGVTSVGPQRAELSICLNGAAVKDRISRGQQKLLAASLLMAQVGMFPRDGHTRPTLLLDDPAAELDHDHLLGLIREIREGPVQLIVTSLNSEFRALGIPGRVYRSGGGTVYPV